MKMNIVNNLQVNVAAEKYAVNVFLMKTPLI